MEMILIILVMVGLMFFMTRNQRKKQQEAESFRTHLQTGDEDMTQTSGRGVGGALEERGIAIEATEEHSTRWVTAAVGPVPPTMVPQPEDDEEYEDEDDAVTTSDDSTITAEDIENNQN